MITFIVGGVVGFALATIFPKDAQFCYDTAVELVQRLKNKIQK